MIGAPDLQPLDMAKLRESPNMEKPARSESSPERTNYGGKLTISASVASRNGSVDTSFDAQGIINR